jgi:acyl-CoA synthetase (AMP-forming)/AMP-acid ligase II
MKLPDPLLEAWQKTLDQRGSVPALVDEEGTLLRNFQQVEKRAEDFAASLSKCQPGAVIGVQIGNHPDWPSIMLACLRRQLVMVPVDQSMRARDRSAALEVCRASALVSGVSNGGTGAEISLLDAQKIDWGDHPPSLLKLTSGTTAAPRTVQDYG